ncbi:hypothetical protein Goarm_001039, partial [Gossypium armourianum]|nr:hypothetical protein [Gossypium armourianum]
IETFRFHFPFLGYHLILLNIWCRKPVKKVGKNKHHLWKKRDSASSRQKELNPIRIVSLICLFILY